MAASVSAFESSTSRLTTPYAAAASAVIGSPVKNISLTTLSGRAARKWLTPAVLYGTPSRTGVTANVAERAATTRSHVMASSQAPPQTPPSTAAITGNGAERTSWRNASSGFVQVSGSEPSTGSASMS